MDPVFILLLLLVLMNFIPALLGLFLIYHTVLRTKHSPVDSSNRINHIRLVWFALNREEDFVDLFPWLKRDEKENLK